MNAKVSFVMPNYNKGLYIAEAIHSILKQTLSDIELVIVDDASTDYSRDIIDAYAKQDKRIKPIYLDPVDLPVAERIDRGRNIGNNAASSSIICVTDSDDWYLPERAELSYKTLKRRKDCGLFYGRSLLRGEFGEIKKGLHQSERILRFSRHRLWKTCMFYISHPTVAYRKEIILKHPYNSGGGVGDWGMFYDLLINHDVKPCYTTKAIHKYRVYANTWKQVSDRKKKDFRFQEYLFEKKRKKMDKAKCLKLHS